MSSTTEPVSAEALAYIARHAPGDDAFLLELKAAALEAGLPEIWIAPEQAALMQVLIRLGGCREVVELGTLGGYSAIAMARALGPGGRLRTIEIEPRHVAFASRWIARSDAADRIQVLEGSGHELLPEIPAGSIDAVFIDAEKEGYPDYLRESLRILRPGGLLMADNALASERVLDEPGDDPLVEAIRAFNAELAGTAGIAAVIVPLGDGLWVGVKE